MPAVDEGKTGGGNSGLIAIGLGLLPGLGFFRPPILHENQSILARVLTDKFPCELRRGLLRILGWLFGVDNQH